MMEYREFVEKIKQDIKERLKGECDVTVKTDLRNNGILSDVLSIQPVKGASGTASVLPLRDYYKTHMSNMEFEACVETIIRNFRQESSVMESLGFGENTVPWENVKDLVYPVLLSVKENWLLLESLVWRPMLDLSISYIIRMEIGEGEPPLSTRITEILFDTWRISEEQLYQKAMENLEKEAPVLISMDSLSSAALSGEKPKEAERVEKEQTYILSNSEWYYGTSMILNKKYLKEISRGCSFYLLPATLHEIILVGDSDKLSAKSMNAMAELGNREVRKEEQFQNHAYYYDAETGDIISCL